VSAFHGLAIVLGCLGLVTFGPAARGQWRPQVSGTESRLRGLSVVSSQVAWASGARGTVLRTIDGGASWRRLSVPGAERLDFRDLHAVDDRAAWILASGPGEQSLIERTTDGGATWALSYRSDDPRVFLDAIAFWDSTHGIAQGDPVDGRFLILTTDDGGRSWKPAPGARQPPALAGEGAFAASGTCLVTQGDRNAWFGTGAAKVARVFRSTDRGQSWTVADTPLAAGSPSSGIFSLAFRDADHGVAVGGDYLHPEKGKRIAARTTDGGRTWLEPKGPGPASYRSAVAYIPGTRPPTLVTVGPNGADVSTDDGETWKPLGSSGFDAIGFAGSGAGWAVGDGGRIARFEE
jgi:photosystem II stability/assembly factor-like uncharacterized protein